MRSGIGFRQAELLKLAEIHVLGHRVASATYQCAQFSASCSVSLEANPPDLVVVP